VWLENKRKIKGSTNTNPNSLLANCPVSLVDSFKFLSTYQSPIARSAVLTGRFTDYLLQTYSPKCLTHTLGINNRSKCEIYKFAAGELLTYYSPRIVLSASLSANRACSKKRSSHSVVKSTSSVSCVEITRKRKGPLRPNCLL